MPNFEEATPLWKVLKQWYNFSNGARKQQLKAALAACQQPVSMSIAEYFGQLQGLWDEMATYNPLPNCICDKCTCNLGSQLQQRLDDDRLQDFLFSINTKLYGNMRFTILAHDPLSSLDRVYQMFCKKKDCKWPPNYLLHKRWYAL